MPSLPPTAIACAPLSSRRKRTSGSVSCGEVGSGTKPPAIAPKNSSAIGARVLEPDEYARAGLKTSLAQAAGDAQHRVLELRKRPHLGRPRSLGIVDDDQRRLTGTRRRGPADA